MIIPFQAISCNSLRRLSLKWKGTLQSWTYRSADQRDSSSAQQQQQQQQQQPQPGAADAPALPLPMPPMPVGQGALAGGQGALAGMALPHQQGPQSRDYERNLLVSTVIVSWVYWFIH